MQNITLVDTRILQYEGRIRGEGKEIKRMALLPELESMWNRIVSEIHGIHATDGQQSARAEFCRKLKPLEQRNGRKRVTEKFAVSS